MQETVLGSCHGNYVYLVKMSFAFIYYSVNVHDVRNSIKQTLKKKKNEMAFQDRVIIYQFSVFAKRQLLII